MSTVYPSGLACDTSPAATVPPAPSTFWTTIWAPSLADIGSAINRVTVSVGPPAENGTTMVMFRSGYPPAPPPPVVSPSESPEHAATTSETAMRRTSGLTTPSGLGCLMQPTSLSPAARDGLDEGHRTSHSAPVSYGHVRPGDADGIPRNGAAGETVRRRRATSATRSGPGALACATGWGP